MVERDEYTTLLTEIRGQLDALKSDPRSTSYQDLLALLDRVVKQSRRAARKLEKSGWASDALVFYELIVDAYRTARGLAPRRERAALSEMAEFWESMLEGKRLAAQKSKRVRRSTEFETPHPGPPDIASGARASQVQPVDQAQWRQAQMRPTGQAKARLAQRNSFLKKQK